MFVTHEMGFCQRSGEPVLFMDEENRGKKESLIQLFVIPRKKDKVIFSKSFNGQARIKTSVPRMHIGTDVFEFFL